MADTGQRRRRTGVAKAVAAATREPIKRITSSAHKASPRAEPSPEERQEELLSDREFEPGQEVAFVRMSAGGTYNLGNFESLRIDVSVTIPCLPSEVPAALDTCGELVATKLSDEERTWGIGNRKG